MSLLLMLSAHSLLEFGYRAFSGLALIYPCAGYLGDSKSQRAVQLLRIRLGGLLEALLSTPLQDSFLREYSTSEILILS